MSSVTDLSVGDIGTIIRLTVKEDGVAVDLSSATTKELVFKKPNGTTVSKTALFETDGTDGILQYTTIAGDLDVAGRWKVQANLELASWSGHTQAVTFSVVGVL